MPTRNISLTREQDAFIAQVVDSGEYQNASEAVRDAVRSLQQRRRVDALKLKALRAAIKVGQDALDRGDYDVVDDSQLEAYLDSLTPASRKRAQPRDPAVPAPQLPHRLARGRPDPRTR